MNKSTTFQGDKKLKLQRSLETFLVCVCVSRFVIIQSNEITRTRRGVVGYSCDWKKAISVVELNVGPQPEDKSSQGSDGYLKLKTPQ